MVSFTILLFFALTGITLNHQSAFTGDVKPHRFGGNLRATLDGTMLVITLGSLGIYGDVALGHINAKIGFVFLMVPLASWLLIAVVVPIAALVSRRTG
jgi:hypothetical protein